MTKKKSREDIETVELNEDGIPKRKEKLVITNRIDRFVPPAYEEILLKKMKQELGLAYAEKNMKVRKEYVYVRVLMGKRDEVTLSERDDEKMRKTFFDLDHIKIRGEL